MNNEFTSVLLGKPSVDTGRCAICGKPGGEMHHVVQKGMGGVSAEIEAQIPKMRLCGWGNTSGHHGMLHGKYLHVYWHAEAGWVYYISSFPMDDMECWMLNSDRYMPVPGWIEQQVAPVIYGRRR